MDSSLKTDLESLVLDFKHNIAQINIKDCISSTIFLDKCQDLLSLYRTKMFNSVSLFSHQSSSEYFLEEYIPSLKYHSECQRLLEVHLEKSFLD